MLVNYFLAMDIKSHQECRMTYSDSIPFIEYYSLGLPKNGRHNAIINHEYIGQLGDWFSLLLYIDSNHFSLQFAVFVEEWSTFLLGIAVHAQRRQMHGRQDQTQGEDVDYDARRFVERFYTSRYWNWSVDVCVSSWNDCILESNSTNQDPSLT